MPTPYKWNDPGLKWNSGATWNGMAPTKTKSMNTTKATIDFSGYTAVELGPIAHTIHGKLTTNAASFTNPPLSLATFLTQITTYDEALFARASNAKADILAFNEAREVLETSLGWLGNHVNTVAKGDPILVEESGFPSYETNRPPNTSPPAAPTDLRLRHGEVSGTIIARYKPDRPGTTNELQCNSADPNVEANWLQRGIYQGGRAEITGCPPGAVIWVRVRTVGLKGVMGAWSDPAQIRVL